MQVQLTKDFPDKVRCSCPLQLLGIKRRQIQFTSFRSRFICVGSQGLPSNICGWKRWQIREAHSGHSGCCKECSCSWCSPEPEEQLELLYVENPHDHSDQRSEVSCTCTNLTTTQQHTNDRSAGFIQRSNSWTPRWPT